jgi:hypothetical protein
LGLTERDLFASQVASPNYTCSACLEESTEEEGVALACVCNNNTPVFYCNTCLYRNIAQRSTECMNMNSCNKLLPYPIILDASEGGFFNLWLVRVQRGGSSAAEGYVEEALRASDEVVTRYLNQLVALVSNKSDGDFKMATCTHEGCVFQALVEQDHAAPVPCYFHADNRICVQCSHNHNHTTSHQCRTNQIFESAAERREARSMPCPNPACKVETQRTEGCMHMTCTRCDHHWCWYCVWHFFGEPEEEHGDKIRAYATRLEYTQGHMEPLHGGAFFLNGDQYTRYCSTPNCPCKRPYF